MSNVVDIIVVRVNALKNQSSFKCRPNVMFSLVRVDSTILVSVRGGQHSKSQMINSPIKTAS